jgi:hypothetical protein
MSTLFPVLADLATTLDPGPINAPPRMARGDPDETDRRPPDDPLRRVAHVGLVCLLSPALLAVLTVGGLAVLIQGASRVGRRLAPGTARRWLSTRRGPRAIVARPGHPSPSRGMWRACGQMHLIDRSGISPGHGGERSTLLPDMPTHPMLSRARRARASRDAATS